MKILVDLHCHTVASTHAHSTVLENIAEAKEKGLEAIAITNHCPPLGDAPHIYHFTNISLFPKEIKGFRVLRGCEANILDLNGNLGIDDSVLKRLDIVIASIHNPVYKDLGAKDNTSAYLKALENPYVDILGHSGNPLCPYDIERVVSRAKELNKFIEINENTFAIRPNNISLCKEIALCAKQLRANVVVNSDAHIATDVGEVGKAISMLKEIDFPEELIANRSFDSFRKAISQRKQI